MFFTDKMPENCTSCPCADGEYGVCNIDYSVGLSADDRPKECPLQEVKHAHWADCKGKPIELDSNGYTKVESLGLWCSHCHEWLVPSDEYIVVGRYCPNCGAKMDEEEKQ